MVRRLAGCLFIYLAGLACVPGCSQMPYVAGDPIFGSRRMREPIVHVQPNDHFSTASGNQDTQAKSIPRPANNIGSITIEDVLKPDHEKKPRSFGDPSMLKAADIRVEIEPSPPKDSEPQIAPPPLPLPLEKPDKTDYAPAVKALQDMIDGRHQEAIQQLRVYDDATQEFLIRLLPPLTMFLKRPISEMSPQEVAVLIEQLDRLREAVRSRSELAIGKMCYCEQVMGYAWYKALPDSHPFLSASKDRPGEFVQLYVELKNFASEQAKDGEYVTRLACVLEITNAKGEVVMRRPIDKSQTTLPRRARLHDLYSTFCFYVPALPAGKYQLTIQIADETTNPERPRIARKSLDFHVTPVVSQASR